MQALAIATSALVAQAAVVNVVAQNVANALTPGYPPKTASLVSMNPGVRVGAVVDAPPESGAGDYRVDLGSEFATLIMARTAYAAALKIFGASERMSNALLASV